METVEQLQSEIDSHSAIARRIIDAVERVIVGQEGMIERLLIGLFGGGHILIEGVPGLAKTLTVSSLAGALHATFNRIQFTPDLLPADLVGTMIFNPKTSEFYPRKGPIFANIVLADEINRAPAKVQSALLEAMQEKRVTIGDESHDLPRPFLVLATMNPIEQEGTYQLPEAQMDRFMLKLRIDYPNRDEERRIVDRMASTSPSTSVDPIVEVDEVMRARRIVDAVHVDEKIKDYAVEIARTTREPAKAGLDLANLIEFGASPRASINLVLAAKAHAFLQGRAFVTPADVKAVGPDVLRHRIIVSYEAQAENVSADAIVSQVLDHVPIP
jgi:MoxR-like ATPase